MNIVSQIFGANRLSQPASTIALKWRTGTWTYAQLRNAIQQASVTLSRLEIKPSQRVVLQCSDTPNFVAFYFAVLNIGAVAIAVSTRLNSSDLEFVIKDSNAVCLVFDSNSAALCKQVIERNKAGLIGVHLDDFQFDQELNQELETIGRSAQHEALWVYSSGSTSKPKGIVHTHKDFSNCCDFHLNNLNLKLGDTIFCTSKLSFAYALANALLVPLKSGVTVYLHPNWVTLESVQNILQQENLKVLFSVPSIYRGILDRLNRSVEFNFSKIKYFVSAGEHLPSAIQKEWKQRTNRTVINVYGCSETLFLAFAGNHSDTPENSVGRPLSGVIPRLVNGSEVLSEDSEEKAVLHLQHPNLFTYYANREVDTKERLVNKNFITGDLYRKDAQGYWYHMGREDELIKVAGQWVYLRDIEKSGLKSGVAFDVAVVSTNDDSGMVRPALFFIPTSGFKAEDALLDMTEHIRQTVPRLKRPSWIRVLEDFPRTHNGKISRHELQSMVKGSARD